MSLFKCVVIDDCNNESVIYWDNIKFKLYDEKGDNIEIDNNLVDLSKTIFPVKMVSNRNPVGKVKSLKKINIQLGVDCNYKCSYCSQKDCNSITKPVFDDVEKFLKNINSWFDGGVDGIGQDVQIQFWGGEPLLYWDILKPLAEGLILKYPNANYSFITNGSLITQDIAEWIVKNQIGVAISHDGEAQIFRGSDPLSNKKILKSIKYILDNNNGRISFNTVLHKNNMSLDSIRRYISNKLEIDEDMLNLTTEGLLTVHGEHCELFSITDNIKNEFIQNLYEEIINGKAGTVATVQMKIDFIINMIRNNIPIFTLGQKCGMDREDSIAVTLSGNILNCHNFTEDDPKNIIGNISDIDKVLLNNATHFMYREKCKVCPVVLACQGSCMLLSGDNFDKTCNNIYLFTMSIFISAIKLLLGKKIVKIESEKGDILL